MHDLFFVDLVGVMYDGVNPYEKSIQAVNRLIEGNKTVIFLSNNPRPSSLSIKKIKSMGVKDGYSVITSGDYTRHLLTTTYKDKKIFHLGAEKNSDILEGLNVKVVKSLEEADIVLLTLFIEQDESVEKYYPICDKIALSRKTVLCANPDKIALYGKTLRTCAGTFAQYIQQKGGTVLLIGKPEKGFYEHALDTLNMSKTPKDKMIMIGDTIETDIDGARNFGIPSMLVLTGVTSLLNKERTTLETLLIPYHGDDFIVANAFH